NTIKDLEDKSIAYIKNESEENVKEYLKKKINYKEILVEEFSILPDMLTNKEVEGIVLEESYLNLIKEEIPEFENKIKVIENFEIKVKTHIEDNNIAVNDSPFILYISGIDRYGSVSSVRGRSDVNQIVVVNPKTKKILLLNTPRDYYVQLHNTSGLKDKLTHAGIYGIEKSITTLEDLYNIDINYYLKVNFDSLIKVVNAIDGIDIYSDKSFRAYTNKKVYIKKGWNHLNGEEALAYARERYAYVSGDNHRGENQQQVITAIIDKISSSKVLISKYNNILTSLNGSFETDMPIDLITMFIKSQLNDMAKWEIESIAVTGYNSSNYTYSMGTKYKLYVMEPNWNSVNSAKDKIKEVLNEK
ncbi:MAG: LCP family protein, partial [Bacilli bacterium]|nr:LCP family protein [Bacilli bacterium]